MEQFIHYTACPVCSNDQFRFILRAKDHTVSGKEFEIVECSNCALRFTQDVPGPESIAPYYRSEDYISHSNTSKGWVNSLYQVVRRRTLKQKRRSICRLSGIQKGSLLDLGSGTGAFVKEMLNYGWSVTGLEPEEDARKIAKDINGVELEDTRQFYSLPPGQFDVITMWHVLEHVHDLNGYVEQLKKLLKPSGKLFIAVPNYTSMDATYYGGNWAAYDVPRHLYHFSPLSMKTLMEKHGLTIEQYKPMWFDSFYISLLSSKYKNGKTNYVGPFLSGLRSNLKAVGNKKRCSSITYVIRARS